MKKYILPFLFCFLLYSSPISAKSAEYGREEALLLAQAIEAEASGESYTVMLAVASVLINRTNASSYPHSLGAVIADAGILPITDTPSGSAVRAAADALRGFDPTSGALRYARMEKIEEELAGRVRLCADGWSFY